MAKRPPAQPETHSWAVHHVKDAATLVAIVDAPNAETAIARAIDQENVPPNERGRLMARRRD
jgi:5-deoxy-D-glucuronate isomerase